MDLIEVLWKQDVDLGFSLENATPKPEKLEVDKKDPDATTDKSEDVDKLKTLQTVSEDSIKVCFACLFFCNILLTMSFHLQLQQEPFESDPWAGLNYTIDTETGQYSHTIYFNYFFSFSLKCDLNIFTMPHFFAYRNCRWHIV